jgi:putative YhbY family RNA-binding protein
MPEFALTPKERQALKARAHGLKPVVLLGSSGLSAAVLKEIDRALAAHELIKIRVPDDDRDERDRVFADVAEALSAARVQAIGKLLIMYRPAPEEDVAPRPVKKTPQRPRGEDRPAPRARPARGSGAVGKPSAPKRTTADRRDAERVNRPTAARRDPGASKRAVGRTNAPRRGGGRKR